MRLGFLYEYGFFILMGLLRDRRAWALSSVRRIM